MRSTGLTSGGLLSPRTAEKSLEQKIADEELEAQKYEIDFPEQKEKVRLWDLLSWSMYPFTNSLYEAAKATKEGAPAPDIIQKALKGAVYGALLMGRKTTRDTVDLLAPDMSPFLKSAIGFVGDIVLDPLTYVSFGAAKGAKVAGEAAKIGVTKKFFKEAGEELGKKIVVGQPVRELAKTAVAQKLMQQTGGKTVNEALRIAGRQAYEQAADVGMRFAGRKLASGGPTTMLAGAAEKVLGPSAGTAIQRLPAAIAESKLGRTVGGMFSTSARWGPFKHLQKVELRTEGAWGEVTERIGRTLDDAIRPLVPMTDNPALMDMVVKSTKRITEKPITQQAKVGALLDYMAEAVEANDIKKLQAVPGLEEFYNVVRGQLDYIHGQLTSRKILKAKQYIQNYLPRYYEKAGELGIVRVGQYIKGGPWQKARLFQTVEQAMEKGFKPLPLVDSLRIYISGTTKAMMTHDIVRKIVKDYAIPATKKVLAQGDVSGKMFKTVALNPAKLPVGYSRIAVPGFKRVLLPDDIANVLNRTVASINDPDEFSRILGQFDKVNNFFKKTVTIMRPGFHARNLFSNLWTLFYKDGRTGLSSDRMKAAWKIFDTRDSQEIIEVAGKKLRGQTWYRLARQYNVNTGGFQAAEILKGRKALPNTQLAATLEKVKLNPWKMWGAAGEAVGSRVENVTRIWSWLNDISTGKSMGESAERVKQFFLDYGDITKAEEKIKRFIPFWTWMKKNLVVQMTEATMNPGRWMAFSIKPLRNLDYLKDVLEEEVPEAGLAPQRTGMLPEAVYRMLGIPQPQGRDIGSIMPDYMKEQAQINPFGIKVGGKPLMLNPNLPFQDIGRLPINDLPRSLLQNLAQSVSPIYRAPVELGVNKELFRGKPIQYDEYDVRPVPPVLEAVIAMFPASVKQKWHIEQNEQGQWTMPAKWAYGLTAMFPITNTGEAVRRAATGIGRPFEVENAPFQVGANMAGVKFRPMDVQYLRRAALQNRLARLRAATSHSKRMEEMQ